MNAQKAGSRHPLLFYRRTMNRVWGATLALGLILAAVWGWSQFSDVPLLHYSNDLWLFVGAVVALVLSAFAFLARLMAYVQVYNTHLSIVTPFLRLKVSYRRVQSIYPTLIQQLFPPNVSNWSQRSFLTPFYGKTAVVVDLRGYPLSPSLLKLFLPEQMFSPRKTGLVLLVPDWMKFSTELDSAHGAWLQSQSRTQPSGRDSRYS